MLVNKQWLEDHGLTQEDIDEFRHPGPDIMGGQDVGADTGPSDSNVPSGTNFSGDAQTRFQDSLTRRNNLFTGISDDVRDEIMRLLSTVDEQNEFFFGGADRFLQASQGVDPRFEAFRNSQRGLVSEQFERRGTGGSSAQRNALLRADNALGFQEMNRQNDLLTQSLAFRTAGLENEQLGPATLLQLLAKITANQTR